MKIATEKRDVHGILLINKPSGLTSNAVLQRVKRLLKARKAGHMGCLDPLATGMLPICLGEATKFAHYGLTADKGYRVTAQFGVTTDTGDAQGTILSTMATDHITSESILHQLDTLSGAQMQIPPMYSALKHQGKKLYELARAGIEVERKARPIEVTCFELLAFTPPYAQFKIRCSKGTYVRALISDLGQCLRAGAHVTELHRDEMAGLTDQPMFSLETLETLSQEDRDQCLLPVDYLLSDIPSLHLPQAHIERLARGQVVDNSRTHHCELVRIYDQQQQFHGLGEYMGSNQLKVKRFLREGSITGGILSKATSC